MALLTLTAPPAPSAAATAPAASAISLGIVTLQFGRLHLFAKFAFSRRIAVADIVADGGR